jgi:carbonic anhydrase/acetyltransferase-like protein (isoleucine patch superfamily)
MAMKKNPPVSFNKESKSPTVDEGSFVDDTASVIGDVRIGRGVYLAPFVSVRADEGTPIVIGDGSNLQDGVIVHALEHTTVEIGKRVSIAHGAVIHGPTTIEDNSFVGFRAVIHGSKIGSGSLVGHGAVVVGVTIANKKYVPHGKAVTTQKEADELSGVPGELVGFNNEVLKVNGELSRGYGS